MFADNARTTLIDRFVEADDGARPAVHSSVGMHAEMVGDEAGSIVNVVWSIGKKFVTAGSTAPVMVALPWLAW